MSGGCVRGWRGGCVRGWWGGCVRGWRGECVRSCLDGFGRRQRHREDGPSRHALHPDRAPVRGDHRLHDGEAEPRAPGGPRARGVAPRKALEDVREQPGRNAGSVVLHVQPHRAAPVGRAHPGGHRGPLRRMGTGIGQQIHQDLVQPPAVAVHQRRLLGQLQPPPVTGSRHPRVAHRIDHQRHQIGGRVRERPPGVEPGEQQQVLHQPRHPLRLRLDPAQRVPGLRPRLLPSAPGQLGIAADRRERRAQLMAGVGDEPPDPHLALLTDRERRTDMPQHPVQRRADLPHFRPPVRLGRRHPHMQRHLAPVEREFGDAGGGRGDPAQRPQRDTDHRGPRDPGRDQPGERHTPFDESEPADRALDIAERQAEHQLAVLAGLHPVVTEPGHLGGVRPAVPRYRVQRGELVPVQRRQPVPGHPPGRVAQLRPGLDSAVGSDPRPDRPQGLAPERHEVQVVVLGPHRIVRRRPLRPGHRNLDLPVQLPLQIGVQGNGRHRPDDRPDDGDHDHRRHDEPGPQRPAATTGSGGGGGRREGGARWDRGWRWGGGNGRVGRLG